MDIFTLAIYSVRDLLITAQNPCVPWKRMRDNFDLKKTRLIESVSKPYPDTGESGETYDMEIIAGHGSPSGY
jgi:hypothetical protein